MSSPILIDLNPLYKKVEQFEKDGVIDSTENLEGAPVYIFHGKKDSTVRQKVGLEGETMYEKYGADLKTELTLDAEHTLPTDNHDLHGCSVKGEPWISDCDYQGAYEALTHLSDKAVNEP